MSYIFYKNWPYYDTVFPTMEPHIDKPYHAYFEGLHAEVENIEKVLGVLPQGAYPDVAALLSAVNYWFFFYVSGMGGEGGLVNTSYENKPDILSMVYPWPLWKDDYDIYVRFSAHVSISPAENIIHVRLHTINSLGQTKNLVTLQKTGYPGEIKTSAWLHLNTLLAGEEGMQRFFPSVKVDGGVGLIYYVSLFFKYIPK